MNNCLCHLFDDNNCTWVILIALLIIFQPELRRFLGELKHIPIDAVIVADLGVLANVKALLPDMEIHISTQASICSPDAAVEYAKLGASRLVLARELTLPEIAAIRASLPERIELEAFVHVAMCVSYS